MLCRPVPSVRIEMLHIDHIKNGGCRQRRKHEGAGGIHIYWWAVNHPKQARKKLQILCANHDRMKQRLGSIEAIVEDAEDAFAKPDDFYFQESPKG